MALGGRGAVTALLVLLSGAAALGGCLDGNGSGGGLGPNDPQLVLYGTADNHTQVVVKGAFKALEFDVIQVKVDNVTLILERNTYVASGKVANRTFDLDVRAVLDDATYTYEARFSHSAQHLEVAERADGKLMEPREESLPYARILEKEPDKKGVTA